MRRASATTDWVQHQARQEQRDGSDGAWANRLVYGDNLLAMAALLARDAVAPGTTELERLVEHFGTGVLQDDGTLDRAALRRRVFTDPVARDALNAIIHPAVARLRAQRVAEAAARGDAVVISDIPLLFEVGLEHAFDGVILVDAPAPVRLERLIRDRGLSREEAQAMMDAQWPAERKRAGATWIIDNDGPRAQLTTRVADLWPMLQTLPLRAAPADTLP